MEKVTIFRTTRRVSKQTEERLLSLFTSPPDSPSLKLSVVRDGPCTEFQFPYGVNANDAHHMEKVIQHLIAWDENEEIARKD